MSRAELSLLELGGLALARQFPVLEGRDVAAVAEMVAKIGPIQSQTARAPFLGLAARMPGVMLDSISAAYTDYSIVRGSNIRGTIHTSTPADHALLEATTRVGERTLWARFLKLDATTLEQVWTSVERFAVNDWRTPDELRGHLAEWIGEHDPKAKPDLESDGGKFVVVKHGGLVRRPINGEWQSQARPEYRTATTLLGDRGEILADADRAMDSMVRRHLSVHGPATRRDIAWWSGVGLRRTDAAIARIVDELTEYVGPDGVTYHDLADSPDPVELTGLRLLPEFDALLCGYEPAGRERFITAERHDRLWTQSHALVLAPLLYEGRMTGYWRLTGSAGRREVDVSWFTGTHRPTTSELDEPIANVETAYGVTINSVKVSRDQP